MLMFVGGFILGCVVMGLFCVRIVDAARAQADAYAAIRRNAVAVLARDTNPKSYQLLSLEN